MMDEKYTYEKKKTQAAHLWSTLLPVAKFFKHSQ